VGRSFLAFSSRSFFDRRFSVPRVDLWLPLHLRHCLCSHRDLCCHHRLSPIVCCCRRASLSPLVHCQVTLPPSSDVTARSPDLICFRLRRLDLFKFRRLGLAAVWLCSTSARPNGLQFISSVRLDRCSTIPAVFPSDHLLQICFKKRGYCVYLLLFEHSRVLG
jgi:hypothetical protein